MLFIIDASRANRERKTGVEWYSFRMITELLKIIPGNHQVILFSDSKLREDWPAFSENVSVSVLSWPPRFLWTLVRLSIALFSFRKKDAIFISTAGALPFFHPKKVVAVIHDVGFMVGRQWYSLVDRWYQKFVTRHVTRCATRMVTPSVFSKTEIIRFFGVNETAISVIPNAPAFQSASSNHRGQNYFLYVGRIENKKNIVTLIDAFEIIARENSGVNLHLVGNGGYGSKEIFSRLSKSIYKNRIILCGHLSAHKLEAEYQNAIVFVFPSLYEGFGIPLLEAMQSGVPVLASNIPAHYEVCGKYASYFDVLDVSSLATLMRESIKGSNQISLQDAATYAKQFSWEKSADSFLKLLQSLDNSF